GPPGCHVDPESRLPRGPGRVDAGGGDLSVDQYRGRPVLCLPRPAGDAAPGQRLIPQRLLRSRKGTFGLVVLLGLVLVALCAPWLAPYSPNEIHLSDQLAVPSAQYLFGTDEVGRDVLSRVIF